MPSRDWNEDRHPVEGGDGDGDFTLSRSGPMTVEELDLAPMVDVAFQLVLFFMVTATTVLFKTLEIPKPSADPPPGAVAQGQSRSLDDFKDDYILVEVDAAGSMKIDHEPVAAELNDLAERLRTAREKTGRKAMLLSAEFATPHRHAVLAYDAANEIGWASRSPSPRRRKGRGPGYSPGRADRTRPPAQRIAPPADRPGRRRRPRPRAAPPSNRHCTRSTGASERSCRCMPVTSITDLEFSGCPEAAALISVTALGFFQTVPELLRNDIVQ